MTYRQHLRRARHLAVVFGYPVSLPWQEWQMPDLTRAIRLERKRGEPGPATRGRLKIYRQEKVPAPVFERASEPVLTMDAPVPAAQPALVQISDTSTKKKSLFRRLIGD
jgi:hypothetical protein